MSGGERGGKGVRGRLLRKILSQNDALPSSSSCSVAGCRLRLQGWLSLLALVDQMPGLLCASLQPSTFRSMKGRRLCSQHSQIMHVLHDRIALITFGIGKENKEKRVKAVRKRLAGSETVRRAEEGRKGRQSGVFSTLQIHAHAHARTQEYTGVRT